MLLWVLKAQNERRGSQSVYWRCVKAIDPRIVKALHAKGKRLMKEAGKKGGKIAGRGRPKGGDRPSPDSGEPLFDAEDEQLKLAGIRNKDYLSKVKYVEGHKPYWNDVIKAIRAELEKLRRKAFRLRERPLNPSRSVPMIVHAHQRPEPVPFTGDSCLAVTGNSYSIAPFLLKA